MRSHLFLLANCILVRSGSDEAHLEGFAEVLDIILDQPSLQLNSSPNIKFICDCLYSGILSNKKKQDLEISLLICLFMCSFG